MPRQPRFFIPGLPLHVVQRGNNRSPVFRGPEDFIAYRRLVALASRRHAVVVHAYVLMTNHVHLLVTPLCASGVPRMMQSIGRVYVRDFNEANGRTGTLWEGRYKATIVDGDSYLLACMRYIELNPVRAGLVGHASEYRWSSHHANARGAEDSIVVPHGVYVQLAGTFEGRLAAYRALFAHAIPDETLRRIRDATQHEWALGDDRFCRNVSVLSRRARPLPKGPRRKTAAAASIDSDPLFFGIDSDPI